MTVKNGEYIMDLNSYKKGTIVLIEYNKTTLQPFRFQVNFPSGQQKIFYTEDKLKTWMYPII